MKLLGIEFGRVWNAAFICGSFGEGLFWYHRHLRPVGLDWRGSTFVARTTTLEPRVGNMPLRGTTPRERFPRCVRINWRAGAVLNAVGLSGLGLEALLADGRWQARTGPFLISFAAVGDTPDRRAGEVDEFGRSLAASLGRRPWNAPIGIELNLSCPNTGHNIAGLAIEARVWLGILRDRLPAVPLIPKVNVLMPMDVVRGIAERPVCDAICISNTIPWGWQPPATEWLANSEDGVPGRRIDWEGLFGDSSPLAHLGGGGLSGAPLLPIVSDWVAGARKGGFPKPIIAGGGVLSIADAHRMVDAGADAIELGSVAILRPWRVKGIIRFADYRLRRMERSLAEVDRG